MPVDGWMPLAIVPLFAYAAWRTQATTTGGTCAGVAVAAVIAAGAGWPGLVMLTAFVVGGTALSRKGETKRDAIQVLCNGGVAAGAGLGIGMGIAGSAAAFGAALTTAFADTIAGEIGQRSKQKPRALLFGKELERGTDGAMTVAGTAAAAIAALALALLGTTIDTRGTVWITRTTWIWASAGFMGQWIDSALGLWAQPKLGRRGNDWVNALATALGAGIAYAVAPA